MEFDETPRFWCSRVALDAWINFTSCSNEILRSNFRKFEKEAKRRKIKYKNISAPSLSSHSHLSHAPFDFSMFFFVFIFFFFFLLLVFLLLLFWKHGTYCFIQVSFYPETIYFFSVHFILNELSPSHFLTFDIFVKILSMKSLATYHPENRKIFRLSHNSMKFFWVTRFRKTNLTSQSVSSFEI